MDAGNARRRRLRGALKQTISKLLVAVGILMWICSRQDGGAVQYPTVDLVPISDSHDGHDDSADYIHDFSLAGIVASLVGHPQRLLKTRHVAAIPHLLTQITGPVFAIPVHPVYEREDANATANLLEWIEIEKQELCLTLWELHDDFVPKPENFTVASGSGPEDVVFPERKEDQELEKEAKQEMNEAYPDPHAACSLTHVAILTDSLSHIQWVVHNALVAAQENFGNFFDALLSLEKTEFSLTHADVRATSTGVGFWRQELDRIVAVSPSTNRTWATPLERASSSSSSPYEFDNLTALVLALLRGGRLLQPVERGRTPLPPVLGEFLHRRRGWNYKPPPPPRWPTETIRRVLVDEVYIMNQTCRALREHLLPMARRWVDIVASEGHDTPLGRSGRVARFARAVADGADHLEFLAGFLCQTADGLWALRSRLDRWDAEVVRVGSEIDFVLRSEKQFMLRPEGKRAKKGEKRVIERWRIGAGMEFIYVLDDLMYLDEDLMATIKKAESFDPDDGLEDAWFRRRMENWNRRREAERAAWASERAWKTGWWDTMWRDLKWLWDGIDP